MVMTTMIKLPWLCACTQQVLASLSCHWLVSQSALWVCGAVWGWHNIPLEDVMRSVFFTAVTTFFKARARVAAVVAVALACCASARSRLRFPRRTTALLLFSCVNSSFSCESFSDSDSFFFLICISRSCRCHTLYK